MKKISILGSTGSIGVNTLKVIDNLKDRFKVTYLAANSRVKELCAQAKIYKPKAIIIGKEELYNEAKNLLSGSGIEVLCGKEGLIQASSDSEVDVVVNALVGSPGLIPTVAAAKAGKYIALANKESLVMAGDKINALCKKTGAALYPIDSEHSAILQCLAGEELKTLKKIYLTASGGPFRNRTKSFEEITVQEALKHPNWSMGQKITIDSATMMNKGFELIEAVHLFQVTPEAIQIVVHPESIIHSMVEFQDSSIIAQLGMPDMRLPIQYALTYPKREKIELPQLDFFKLKSLTFQEPDFVKFPALRLTMEAIKERGTMPVVLNAVNEIMVYKFLSGNSKFTDITNSVEKELAAHKNIIDPTIDDILAVNKEIWKRLN